MKNALLICLVLSTIPVFWSFTPAHKVYVNHESQNIDIQTYKTKHHIILVIDGPRWTETFGDTSYQYIPNMGKILKKEGTLFTNFQNGGSTYTNSGHTALLTGVHQRISNQGTQLPKNPNIFQYLLKEKGLDKRKAWLLTSKGKLEMLANTKDKKWWNTYMPSTYCGARGHGVGYPDDIMNWEIFKGIIKENKPVLTLINLLDIDVWGHANDWDKYIASHTRLDSLAMDLWNMIQNDPEMANKTALYITNDHGRHLDGHKDGFKSHGDGCEGCRHISLLAIGPDLAKNREVATEYDQIDLTASLAFLLGIEMPTGKGCVIPELIGK